MTQINTERFFNADERRCLGNLQSDDLLFTIYLRFFVIYNLLTSLGLSIIDPRTAKISRSNSNPLFFILYSLFSILYSLFSNIYLRPPPREPPPREPPPPNEPPWVPREEEEDDDEPPYEPYELRDELRDDS